MKIAHIFWSYTLGGAETMVSDIIDYQTQTHEVHLIIINKAYDVSLLKKINPKALIKLLNRKKGSKNPLPFLALNLYLISKHIEVIHCHNYSLDKVVLSPMRSKLILTIHGSNRPIRANNHFKKIIVISNALKLEYQARGITNICVVYNGIKTKEILEKKYFNSGIKVVCIGRLIHEIKGQDKLIRSIPNILEKDKTVKFYFIGEGPSYNFLTNLVHKLNIEANVFFTGPISRAEIYKTLKDYDMLIQPSISEGFGLTTIEAMIAKVPILISKASGLVEVSNSGEHARIININDPINISQSILNLITRIKKSDNFLHIEVDKAYSYALSNFDVKDTSDNYLRLYEGL